MKKLLRSFVTSQQWCCRHFDRLLPELYRIDGNSTFGGKIVPAYLKDNATVIDVGGGKSPSVSPEQKSDCNITLIGIDIEPEELNAAPKGLYDNTIVGDIANLQESTSGDVVICRTVLEHVKDVSGAFENLAALCKPGGHLLLFVPSRNALFARLSLLLPEKLKRQILFAVFPATREKQGFPAYYDRCTPRDFRHLAAKNNLEVETFWPFFKSSYFSFFFPFYLAWRLWILTFHLYCGEQAAETFAMVLRKP